MAQLKKKQRIWKKRSLLETKKITQGDTDNSFARICSPQETWSCLVQLNSHPFYRRKAQARRKQNLFCMYMINFIGTSSTNKLNCTVWVMEYWHSVKHWLYSALVFIIAFHNWYILEWSYFNCMSTHGIPHLSISTQIKCINPTEQKPEQN